MKITPVPSFVNFPETEEAILKFWKENDCFQKSLDKNKDKKPFVFYDGPPFATGLPHYGHILTSYIKDTVPRYFTMQGFFVDRRWGWDCHGLPVEFEAEKNLNISGKKEIEKIGLATFNGACHDLVLKYAKDWIQIIDRIGRWVDFDRQYKTMDADYMESVLWVFSQLHERGWIYESQKVLPYCIRCQTSLSNFETGLDDSYREKQDRAITVKFEDLDEPGTNFLSWTTTPWTLPSNVALGVHPDIEYSKVEIDSGEKVWMASNRLEAYKKELPEARVVEKKLGKDLVGKVYKPLFNYFAGENRFRIIAGDFISDDNGTGFVHLAPRFGEDDQVVCSREGIEGVDPLTSEGKFQLPVADFEGMEIFESNKSIIRFLKNDAKLFSTEDIKHNYPHCWRCDQPLIYRGINSWFVKVTAIKSEMVAANQKIRWVPNHIKDGRFGQWLEGAKDWAISRNRFWGSPIPVWRCGICKNIFVPSSLDSLSKEVGQTVTDLHRPGCDELTWKCKSDGCSGDYKRVPEVLDCWFESGAMPIGQTHYPFENKEWFEENFPADFIVEYVSQTRGWFYTLLVLSTALFNKPPFKNSICHGVIQAKDGRKMSKRLKNYPDPVEILSAHGSDALRISLLSSSVVKGQDIRFSENSVREATRRYLIPLWNSLHFFTSYAALMEGYSPRELDTAKVLGDRYILSELEILREEVSANMEEYDLPQCYQKLLSFIETLSGWHIRNNRPRFWAEEFNEDSREAFDTLYTVILGLAQIAAPFFPFLAEHIYKHLTGRSVHLEDWPEPRPQRKDPSLHKEIESVRWVIEAVRKVREKNSIQLRQPLSFAKIAGVESEVLRKHGDLIKNQGNLKELIFSEKPEEFAQPVLMLNSKSLGPILKGELKTVQSLVREGEFELLDSGEARIGEHTLAKDHFNLVWSALDEHESSISENSLVVSLSLNITEELLIEGASRDINRIIQDLRKKLNLPYEQKIVLAIDAEGTWKAAFDQFKDWLLSEGLITKISPSHFEPIEEIENEKGVLRVSISSV